MRPPLWTEITPSEFPWEQEALAFVREGLPDHEPYRAWSNFEFIGEDGSLNEVDLLVVTPKGFFLVEIKSRPGLLAGDAATWRWVTDGREYVTDNPLTLANRKAKRLKSLLQRQKASKAGWLPFLEAVIFCSARDLKLQLNEHGRTGVFLRDREATEDRPGRRGILHALTDISPEHASSRRFRRLDRPTAKRVARALDEAGIRPSQASRRVGDYRLGELVVDGPGYQEFDAEHAGIAGVHRRVRLYPLSSYASNEERKRFVRAAQREFKVLEEIEHPGILRPIDYREHERGPALIFDPPAEAVTLHAYLTQHHDRLSVDDRLDLARQLAEALDYAHKKGLFHRALSPRAILVQDLSRSTPADAADTQAASPKAGPRVLIGNWSTARREALSLEGDPSSTVTRLHDLVDEPSRVYLAPEALTDPDADPVQLDVFSLGAVLYTLFTGKPPASSLSELVEKLRQGRGLQLSDALDGVVEELQQLVRDATHPEVPNRLDSVQDILSYLDLVEEALTSPDEGESTVARPTDATQGDHLDGFEVLRRLGKGSVAVAFQVKRAEQVSVLKLALTPEHNQRIEEEYEILDKLRHQAIVAPQGLVDISGHQGLLMEQAGDKTLAQRIREEGRIHLEHLQRFGEDLLLAVAWLEEQGIPHRDLKPANIGVLPVGKTERLHLKLFDFSLSRVPAERIHAGTPPYLEPFLSERGRWDVHAERFAAAMTLYEMATGTLPRWGDGKSDPALLDCEVTLDSDLFDPALRDAMSSFFNQALRRDLSERFDTCEEMLHAWRRLFDTAAEPAAETDEGIEQLVEAIESASYDTDLVILPFSTRALNALDRLGATNVANLLTLPPQQISHQRGVGNKTRREIFGIRDRLRERFPGPVPESLGERRQQPASRKARGSIAGAKATARAEEAPAADVYSIDLITRQLIPNTRGKRTKGQEAALRRFLHLWQVDESGAPVLQDVAEELGPWPSQTEVASTLNVTRARVSQIVGKARQRWSKLPPITGVREEILRLLEAHEAVMTGRELANALLATRGSSQAEPIRSQQAAAVVRAALETERTMESPRFAVRRAGTRLYIADDREDLGQALCDYVGRLADVAEQLARDDPLPSPSRVRERLRAVRAPEGTLPLSDLRMTRLAAAASETAALSSRLELYPVDLSASRALRLAQGALLGARRLTEPELRERVESRYPEAQRLPPRPELDALLAESGLDLRWDPSDGSGAYLARYRDTSGLTSSSTVLTRQATVSGEPGIELEPEVAEARAFEERLARAARAGRFLILAITPKLAGRVEAELQSGRFAVQVESVERSLIEAMRTVAKQNRVSWDKVLDADGADPTSVGWQKLLQVVKLARAQLASRWLGSNGEKTDPDVASTLVLTRPGLLARYDQLGLLEELRDRVGRPGGPFGLWVVVPCDDQESAPVLDGKVIPVTSPGQWARVPPAWTRNLHRSVVAHSSEASVPSQRNSSSFNGKAES